jgi:hypothetical protein
MKTKTITIESVLPNSRYIIKSNSGKLYTIDRHKNTCTCQYAVRTSTKEVNTTCSHIKGLELLLNATM